jgi:outer membrane protein assembly factor BamD (BamD/ComL family)
MGEKQAGKRQHILFFLTGYMIIWIALSGCMEKDSSYLTKQRIESVLETEGERRLADARNFMASGRYQESLKRSESVLAQYPRSLGDQALLNLGLLYAHPGYPKADVQKSIKYFQRLVEEYPESMLKDEAQIWIRVLQNRVLADRHMRKLKLTLKAIKKDNKVKTANYKKMQLKANALEDQVKELKNQIDRLKSVDIRIEEKKRKNGRQ